MQRELITIKNFIDNIPDTKIWVISGNGIQAKLFWNRIKENIDVNDIKPRIFTSNPGKTDGLSSENALILLCGRWYKNPVADSGAWKYFLKNAKYTIPIGEIPDPKM